MLSLVLSPTDLSFLSPIWSNPPLLCMKALGNSNKMQRHWIEYHTHPATLNPLSCSGDYL